jgi:hypothetical protein
LANATRKKIFILALSLLMAGCGGSGNGSAATTETGAQNTAGSSNPTGATSSGTDANTDADPASADFAATVTAAPPNEGVINGPTRLEVRGSGLENVELLPTDSYQPRLGVFSIADDKTHAWLDFDGTALPNGTLLARIVAFDVPPGASGREIVAMATRTWFLRNDPQPALSGPIPAPGWMPEVWLQLNDLPWVDPEPLNEMMRLDDVAYQELMTNEAERVRQTMRRYVPQHVLLFRAPLGFTGPWYACVDQPAPAACREAMNLTIGLMNGKAR